MLIGNGASNANADGMRRHTLRDVGLRATPAAADFVELERPFPRAARKIGPECHFESNCSDAQLQAQKL